MSVVLCACFFFYFVSFGVVCFRRFPVVLGAFWFAGLHVRFVRSAGSFSACSRSYMYSVF